MKFVLKKFYVNFACLSYSNNLFIVQCTCVVTSIAVYLFRITINSNKPREVYLSAPGFIFSLELLVRGLLSAGLNRVWGLFEQTR